MTQIREIYEQVCLLSDKQKQKNSEHLHRLLDRAIDALVKIQEDDVLRPGDRIACASNEQELLIFRVLQDISCALTGEHWRPIQK